MRILTAIPVYNEEAHLEPVLAEVLRYTEDVLAVDDGSTDRTPELLRAFPRVRVIRHDKSTAVTARGSTACSATPSSKGFDGLVTIDCDGQHEPKRIPEIASGLRRGGHRLREPIPPGVRPRARSRRSNGDGSISRSPAG